MDPNSICPKCLLPVLPVFYFCPNCGKNLRPKPMPTTIGKQIGIYLLSFFLPPYGLWPGIKYLRQEDAKSKIVGGIAIMLTITAFIISYFVVIASINQLKSTINSQLNNQINSQLQQGVPQLNQLPQSNSSPNQ